jgi:ABC-type sugar transport system ATPase subunit
VVISHNLVDVFAVADRIIVLRLGRRVATFDAATSNADQVVAAMTGANVTEVEEVLGRPGDDQAAPGSGSGAGSDGGTGERPTGGTP